MLACDFFTVATLRLQTLYVPYFIELQTRRVFVVGCTGHPSAAWVTQQARQLVWQLEDESRGPTLLIPDRYAKFPAPFDAVFRAANVRVVRTLVRAPRANAVAERWVGTVRRDCLDWLLILGPRHLEQVLQEYDEHYNTARPHRALHLEAPLAMGSPPSRRVLSRRSSGVIGWEGSFTSTSRSSLDTLAERLGLVHPTGLTVYGNVSGRFTGNLLSARPVPRGSSYEPVAA